MLELEYKIIESCLQGDHRSFGKLLSQIKYVKISERVKSSGLYRVEFSYSGPDDLLLEGVDANMEISDTCIEIEESQETLHVDLMILHGHLYNLSIGGNYDMEHAFTIVRNYWEVTNVIGQDVHSQNVLDQSERDFKKSIGYIPTYK